LSGIVNAATFVSLMKRLFVLEEKLIFIQEIEFSIVFIRLLPSLRFLYEINMWLRSNSSLVEGGILEE